MSNVQQIIDKIRLGDAWDEPDTGIPPCLWCRRTEPCRCPEGQCACDCGRCQAPIADGLAAW